jgi:translation initiation factor 4A
VLILDEADEMLSEGFLDAVRGIVSSMPSTTQIGVFSATMPPDVLDLTTKFLKDPVRIVLTKEVLSLQGIRQYYVYLERDEYKFDVLLDLYERLSVSQAVIFVNTRRRADWLAKELDSRDFTVSCIHSDLHPAERTAVMEQFKVGRSRILIATDLVARGIDVGGVGFVINYDLTKNFENYIHRIGRSGRFGRKGLAINFVVERETALLRDLQAFYNTEIAELPQDFTL